MSTVTSDFTTSIIESYNDFYDEIEDGDRNELDLTPRFARLLFCNETLGWDESDYAQEDDLNDIRFYDDERHPVIIIEAKRRDRDVEVGIDQAFEYASDNPYTRFLIATNFDKLLLYRRYEEEYADETRHGVSGELLATINFERVRNVEIGESLTDEIPTEELDAISQLTRLRKSDVVSPERYDAAITPDGRYAATSTLNPDCSTYDLYRDHRAGQSNCKSQDGRAIKLDVEQSTRKIEIEELEEKRDELKKHMVGLEKAKNKLQRGYERGKKDYRITIPCVVCGEEMEMEPESDLHSAAIDELQYRGWGHTRCLKRHQSR